MKLISPAPLSADDAVMQIAEAIEAFENGGPDREAECIQLGERCGLRIDVFRDQWASARTARAEAAKPKPAVSLRDERQRREAAMSAVVAREKAEEEESKTKAAALAVERLKNVAAAGAEQRGLVETARVTTALSSMSTPQPLDQPRGEITLPIEAGATVQMDLLNQKHAVIGNYGGKCLVLAWERWEINQQVMVPTFQTVGDFMNRYKNRYVQKQTDDGVKNVEAGKFWFTSPTRLTYDKVAFEPGEPKVLAGNRLNLWRGFALQPKQGSWGLLKQHIYQVLGAGDPKAGEYIVRWLAWMVQNPGLPAEAVLAFQGEEGAGKGTLARVMMQIFGAHALPVSDPNMLSGQFSGHLQHCCFLFVDEAFWAGDVKSEGRLKSLITEPTITIRPLYVQGFQIRNMLHIMMASNNDWMVPAGHGSRRYAVFKANTAVVGNHQYFRALNAEIDGGGAEAMLYDLLRLDLGDWHPKEVYETTALVEQKGHSLRGLDAWIEDMLQEGALPVPLANYPNRCLSASLLEAATKFDRYTNSTKVAQRLQTVLGVQPFNTKIARGQEFPELTECRRRWETRNGGRWQWRQEVSEWERKKLT